MEADPVSNCNLLHSLRSRSAFYLLLAMVDLGRKLLLDRQRQFAFHGAKSLVTTPERMSVE